MPLIITGIVGGDDNKHDGDYITEVSMNVYINIGWQFCHDTSIHL